MRTPRQKTNVQFLYVRDGIYCARLYQAGGSKWVSLRTKTKSVAKVKLAKLLARHHETRHARTDLEAGSATVGQLAQVYVESQELRTDLKASSKESRRFAVLSIMRTWPELADKLPARVTEFEVSQWASKFHAAWSGSKYNAAVDSLRNIFQLAVDRGIVGTNPAARLVRAKIHQKRLELPTSEQFKEIVKTARTSGARSAKGNGDLIEFLAYSGCRIGEASRVRWKDVDEAAGRIWIAPGKSDQGRHIPINGAMSDLLKRIRENKSFVHGGLKRAGYVMVNLSCEESLAAACETAGVQQRMTHHTLRHYFTTRALESGVPVPAVARWLGHRDSGALLLKTYSHLLDQHSQAIAGKMQF